MSLIEGGDITIMSDNVNIIGGDSMAPGIAGYAVYANNGNYTIYNQDCYNNVVIENGTGEQPSISTTPQYIGY